ncbi:MAG: peptide transporter permease [Polaromonas sp.]|jgi:peptide/nickel transport system permease protein|nr:peptide transporter permease [Polaromonas sp.]
MISFKALYKKFRRHPTVPLGAAALVLLVLMAIAAPHLSSFDPQDLDPLARMNPASEDHLFGTDALGRDLWSRTVWGARVSLIVSASVAFLSIVFGVSIGMLAGYFRRIDSVVMRLMDGLMAIPGVLLAIALMATMRASLTTVVIAIVIPEIPRVVRLVRALVLTIREQPYVEAAVAVGTRVPQILLRHILPNLFAPVMVQATFIAASAVLTEAVLSFLGVGIPPQIPSWGNMMAEGRNYIAVAFHIILYPGLFLAVTVLAINMLGDGLLDMLDPRLARKL